MEGGREFQVDDPENARLVLYRYIRGRDEIKLFEAYLLVDLVNSKLIQRGVPPLVTLNIITTLLYFSRCFCFFF